MSGDDWTRGPVLKLDLFREGLRWTALRDGERVCDTETAREAWEALGSPECVGMVVVGRAAFRWRPGLTIERVQEALATRPLQMPTLAWREVLTVDVPGAPVGAARPRFDPRTKRTYKEKKHELWESVATLAARDAWHGRAPLDELVRVDVIAVVERPNKYVPRRYQGALTKPGEQRMLTAGFDALGRLPCPTKPDLDNVVKLAWDALVKAEVLADDTRVVESTCSKWWTAIGEGPSTRVVVSVGMGGRWW